MGSVPKGILSVCMCVCARSKGPRTPPAIPDCVNPTPHPTPYILQPAPNKAFRSFSFSFSFSFAFAFSLSLFLFLFLCFFFSRLRARKWRTHNITINTECTGAHQTRVRAHQRKKDRHQIMNGKRMHRGASDAREGPSKKEQMKLDFEVHNKECTVVRQTFYKNTFYNKRTHSIIREHILK